MGGIRFVSRKDPDLDKFITRALITAFCVGMVAGTVLTYLVVDWGVYAS